EVAFAGVDNGVERARDQRTDLWLELADRVRDEGGLQDLAVLRVLGRVLEEQQVAVDLERIDLVGIEEDPALVVRVGLEVAARAGDVALTCERPEAPGIS